MAVMKQCCACKQTLPETEFHWTGGKSNRRRQSRCKHCLNKAKREAHHIANPKPCEPGPVGLAAGQVNKLLAW